ncbi:hypothetical protein PF008_g32436, partial [Phytophthora fragariae]
NQKEVIR